MSTENCRILENEAYAKAELRKELLKKRQALSEEYCRRSDKAVLARLLEMEAYKRARVVFTYVSREKEVDTIGLLEHILSEGRTAAVPRCISRGGRAGGSMRAYEIKSLKDLEPGAFGILEPKKGCREVSPAEIGLIVVPCVSCSEEGVRLGYGGGYYDRYLPLTKAPRIFLCRKGLMLSKLPREPHDCMADYVVTEEEILVIPKPG